MDLFQMHTTEEWHLLIEISFENFHSTTLKIVENSFSLLM